MAKPKRRADERRQDLVVLANCLALRHTDVDATEVVNASRARRGLDAISRSQIQYDKKDARRLLADLADIDVRQTLGEQMVRLDTVFREALDAWQRSKEPAHRRTRQTSKRPIKGSKGVELVDTETETEQWTEQAGDARLLAVALDALVEKSELLRLRERELRDKVAQHPQFDAARPTTPQEAAQLLEATTGSRFAATGNLKLVTHPKKKQKR